MRNGPLPKLGDMASSTPQGKCLLKATSASTLADVAEKIAEYMCPTCAAVINSLPSTKLATLDAMQESEPNDGNYHAAEDRNEDTPGVVPVDGNVDPINAPRNGGNQPAKAVPLEMLTELMESGRCAFFDCVQCDETLSCHVQSNSVAMDMDVCGIVYDMSQFCVSWTETMCGQKCTGIGGIRCYTDSQWHQCPAPTGADCKHMPLHKGSVIDVASYVVCRDGLNTKIS